MTNPWMVRRDIEQQEAGKSHKYFSENKELDNLDISAGNII